jgi:hypothetical protein
MLEMPPLLLFSDFGNEMPKYIEALYESFKKDFVDNRPDFRNKRMWLKKHPLYDNKEVTFWHIITSSSNGTTREEDRYVDIQRCERIKWPRVIIENEASSEDIRFWENKRNGKKRFCICYGDWEYLVVLEDRGEYVLLWTAYDIRYPHQRRKLEKEYEKYKTETAS